MPPSPSVSAISSSLIKKAMIPFHKPYAIAIKKTNLPCISSAIPKKKILNGDNTLPHKPNLMSFGPNLPQVPEQTIPSEIPENNPPEFPRNPDESPPSIPLEVPQFPKVPEIETAPPEVITEPPNIPEIPTPGPDYPVPPQPTPPAPPDVPLPPPGAPRPQPPNRLPPRLPPDPDILPPPTYPPPDIQPPPDVPPEIRPPPGPYVSFVF
ncbi:hypothetical protein RCOM_0910720 [Ricinus communis]|uniref:Uncharacterized protein n=1 Tax=Ricinus communis TaxID=3988 RepID=B9RTH9_RICCO|nr:hypothetical protein RCOM_0910720 [Ricinus communis]|eukprot:XP_002517048.1 vegetative cell wall protein gp1 [Ricinus communis]